jgi:PAS domain S-box-containing protein
MTAGILSSSRFGTDQAPHLLFWVTPQGRFIHANEAACLSLGRSREKLLAMNVRDLGMRFDGQGWTDVWEVVRRRRSLACEASCRTDDGSELSVEVTIGHEQAGADEYGVVAGRGSLERGCQGDDGEWGESVQAASLGEEWFGFLIENTLDIITVLDTDLRIRYLSPSAEHVLGYKPEELLGKSALGLIHPMDSWRAMTLIRQALDNPDEQQTGEVRIRHRDGSWRFQEAVGKRLPQSAPIRGLVINLRDTTERRRIFEAERNRSEKTSVQQQVLVQLAASELREQGDLIGAVRRMTAVTARTLEVERASVWLYEDDRTRIRCVDLFARSTNQHSQGAALEAADYPTYFAALESDRVIAADDACLDSRTREFTDSYLRPLGINSMLDAAIRVRGKAVGVVCVEHVGPPCHWATEDQNFVGSIADMVSLAIEAGQREAAEQALRKSEAQYRALVEHATYGIYRSSPEGRFLAVNPALIEMLGYGSEEEVLALDLASDVYVGPQDRASLVERYRQEPAISVEVDWKRRDGSVLPVRLSGRPVHSETGELECFEMIAEDVSKHRRLEDQLRQAQKMEAVGQLTGGIAHDFNNMLSVVMASAELVASALEPHQAEALADVREIQQAAQKTARMVKQLLGFSRRAELSLVPVELGEVISNLSSMLSRVLPESIDVIVDVEPVSTVEADVGAIEQMVLNLATNARDAMTEGGTLKIQVRQMDVDVTPAAEPWIWVGTYVCISVCDNGIGMDQETCSRVFEPFFTTKPPGVGTGLGMAMVYGLTKQHGGFVHVYSEHGKGTTVRLMFPVIEEEARDPDVQPLSDAPMGGEETILLVEDDESVRRIGKRVLERFGYNVITASDGEQGLEAFRRHHSDIGLVISDVVMPRMSGWQLHEALRRECPELKFLMASGYGESEANGAPLGAEVPVVQKPWTVHELLCQIRQVLEG